VTVMRGGRAGGCCSRRHAWLLAVVAFMIDVVVVVRSNHDGESFSFLSACVSLFLTSDDNLLQYW